VISGSKKSEELVTCLSRILLATFRKGLPGRPAWSPFQILGKMRLLCSKISLLLAFVYLGTWFSWKFCANFRYSCINRRQMPLFRSARLFGLLLPAVVAVLWTFLLITMSYIIRTKRFAWKGLILLWLHNLGVYLFLPSWFGNRSRLNPAMRNK
jgi:hypothetical protein